jgi:transposase
LEVGDVYDDDRNGLGEHAGGFPRLSATAGPQGGGRPAVSGSYALLYGGECALPERFGPWNSVWKRFDRLSKAGVFEAFFDTLAGMSASAHLIQMFDSTIVRAHVSAAGAKGGSRVRRSAARAAGSRLKFTPKRTIQAASSRST